MKTAVITGASRGIGLATAIRLAGQGYHLVINSGHNRDALQEAACTLEQFTRVETYFGDISREEHGEGMIARAIDAFGHIDLLINNAGISHIGLLSDMSAAQWHQVMQTNLDSVFFTCRAAIPHMVRRQQGKILNISSVWGEVGASCEAAYSASKGAVNALTKALAKELAPSHISVNAISFGVIDTVMNQCFDAEERQALAEEIPAGRFASPEEAASFCCQIVEAPEYLTGQIIRFDGGWI
ncbi:MAG TPA: SDR family NAD(P)-dependent oxidoreductase [Candidatus Anaerobutyricum faecale]|nr:SDR family NAD(P)-dependent oxidoreductase [Candidatus Anaerobutyricum faecale]